MKTKEQPTKISKEDALTLENFALREELYQMQYREFKASRDAHAAGVRARYDMRECDTVDLVTLAITRAAAEAKD